MRRELCAILSRRVGLCTLVVVTALSAGRASSQLTPPKPTFNPYALPAANLSAVQTAGATRPVAPSSTPAAPSAAPPTVTQTSGTQPANNSAGTLRIGGGNGPGLATPNTTAPNTNAVGTSSTTGSRLEIRAEAAPAVVLPPPPGALPLAAPVMRDARYTTSTTTAATTTLPPPTLTPPTHTPTTLTPTTLPPVKLPASPPGPTLGAATDVGITTDGALTDAPPSQLTPPPVIVAPPSTIAPPAIVEPPVANAPPASLPNNSPPVSLPPTAPIDATAITPLTLEPVDFNGVLLGETTLAEVEAAWGAPVARQADDNAERLNFVIEPFAGVEVAFVDGKAASMIVELGEQFPPQAVIEELGLDPRSAVSVEDESGTALGLVFPERGVSFRYEGNAAKPMVAQIGLDLVTAVPFVLRAERRADDQYSAALIDLATAAKLDADNLRTRVLRAKVLNEVGRTRTALAEVEAALKLEPADADALLLRAELLAAEGMFDAALNDVNTVLSGAKDSPLVQARAWYRRGQLLADGPVADFQQAIDAHTRAVRLAEPLVRAPQIDARLAAKRLLIEAHLAIAEDVAWGEWQQKETVVPQWLTKAERLAKDAILGDGLSPYVILDVYRRALSAHVGMTGGGDPRQWAERLQTAVDAALRDCTDPLKRSQMQFEAGLGLYDALQALHARGDVDGALEYGQAAVTLVEAGRQGRDEQPIDAYRFGRLYFRIGSLYAVAREDHPRAVPWFDSAVPLLERPLPEAAAGDRGRQGETLVSMGITYWAVGRRDEGVGLTELGLEFMEQAAAEGSLDRAALAVPYSNLGLMHQRLGNDVESRRYVQMAARVEPPASVRGTLRR